MKILAQDIEDPDTIEWLQDDGARPFLALWHPDRTGDAKGVLLIIHAEGEHPTWPQTTKPLHDSLPDYGWGTMGIQLPEPVPLAIAKRTIAAKSATTETAPATQKTTEEDNAVTGKPLTNPQVEDISHQRLAAALAFLHTKGQYNIVIMGSGIGAIRTHRFIHKIAPTASDPEPRWGLEHPIRSSIIFNARNKLPNESTVYKDWFAIPSIPVLDIYTDHDVRNEKDARKRKMLSKQAKEITYRQIKIAEIAYETSWQENQLSRRIRSFLNTNYQGFEVKN
jgi:hypothetical protein